MRQLILQIIEKALAQDSSSPSKRGLPPVIVPARGIRIPALSAADLARVEEEEDEAKHR